MDAVCEMKLRMKAPSGTLDVCYFAAAITALSGRLLWPTRCDIGHHTTKAHMKTIITVLLLALATTFAVHAADKERTLFDSEGEAVAYIALDDELNIYLWKGEP